jgi:hypothetical protein
MKRLMHVFLIYAVLLIGCGTAHGQWGAPGYDPYRPVIANVPVWCTAYTGQAVAFVPNWNLPDVGRAVPGLPPRIELNPQVLMQMSSTMQLFWYAHECAHHVLGPANSEVNADCWAIKALRNQGYLAPQQVGELQYMILNTPGSMWGHLPGPHRAQLFAQCYQTP